MKLWIALLTAIAALCGGLAAQTLQEQRWDAAKVTITARHKGGLILQRIVVSHDRYKQAADRTGVPWYVIAALHNMESSGSFRHHLHEGSPLSGRTRWIPKGRPKSGSPPFTWEESAFDALYTLKRMDRLAWDRLHDTLYECERYNGLGYLKYHKSTPTPYLWAGTTIERPGKYVADGKWSSTARSKQTGCAVIWRLMEEKGLIDFRKLSR